MLVAFRLLSRPVRPFLLVTVRRARAIAVETSDPTGIALPDFCSAGEIFSLASAAQVGCQFGFVPAGASAGAAIQLAKHAQRLPALLIGVVEVTGMILVGVFAFRVPLHGSIALLYASLLVYLAAVIITRWMSGHP